MTIQALVGRPRQGKSYSAVELAILPALREGRIVYTNIPLKPKILEDFPNADLRLLDFSLHKENKRFWHDTVCNGALVVADELWRIWPRGLTPARLNQRDDLEFIKEHGHMADETGRIVDIVMVTQTLDDIAVSIAEMVDTTILNTKLDDVGMQGRFRRDYYKGCVYGLNGKRDKYIRSDDAVKYDPSIYQYYKSHTKASEGMATPNETKVVKATIFGGLKFKLMMAAILLLFFVVVPLSFTRAKSGVDKLTTPRAASVVDPVVTPRPRPSQPSGASTNPQSLPAPTPPPPPPKPVLSVRWRISGHYSIPETGKTVVLLSDGYRHRRISGKHCVDDGDGFSCVIGLEIFTSYSGVQTDTQYRVSMPLAVPVASAGGAVVEPPAEQSAPPAPSRH